MHCLESLKIGSLTQWLLICVQNAKKSFTTKSEQKKEDWKRMVRMNEL